MTTAQKTEQRLVEIPVKRVALVMRVSTDRQARNDEGSLKNQIQRLRQHIDYNSVTCW